MSTIRGIQQQPRESTVSSTSNEIQSLRSTLRQLEPRAQHDPLARDQVRTIRAKLAKLNAREKATQGREKAGEVPTPALPPMHARGARRPQTTSPQPPAPAPLAVASFTLGERLRYVPSLVTRQPPSTDVSVT
jgi:hypothetical protein